jgi:hypothetical protein
MVSSYAQVESVSNLAVIQVHDEHRLGEATLADLRNRASEGSRRLESRRRAAQTGAALPSDAQTRDLMHSQREGALKTQRIKSSFSRDPKNCLTRYVRNYSVRSACGPLGKPIRTKALRIILARSAMRVKLSDDTRRRNASSACIHHAHKNTVRIDEARTTRC